MQMARLYEAAKALRGIVGQSDVARALNQSPQTVNNWEARGMSKPGMLKAQAIFGVSATWLESGEGSMTWAPASGADPFLFGTSTQAVRAGDESDTVSIRRVKLHLRAGITGFETEPEVDDGSTLEIPRRIVEGNDLVPHCLFAIKVRGSSMEPMLFEDDTVVVNIADTKPISREVYAINFDGEALVKQLILRGMEWYLHSINSDFGPVNIRSGKCIIIGRVVFQPGRMLTGRL